MRVTDTIDLEQIFSSLIHKSKRLASKEENYTLNTKSSNSYNTKKCNYCKKIGQLEANCSIKNPKLKKDFEGF